MKNQILTAIMLLFIGAGALATEKDSASFYYAKVKLTATILDDCDACGCSASGGSMGFSSMLNSNFVGVRYFYQSYSSRNGIFANSPWIDENFNTMQLWARIPVSNKVQLTALVPYHFHNRALATGTENISGLGDITVMAMYGLANTTKDSATTSHKILVGGGIKAPTGTYNAANNLGTVNPGFQLGTGSWDYMLAAEYVVQQKKLGLNAMANYVFKTENQKDYRFGNQFNYATTLFYLVNFNDVTLVPQAGLAGELYGENRQYNQAVADTSGDVLFGKLGIEAGIKKLSVGVNMMRPIDQSLTGGKVKANHRWSINLNYTL